MKTITNEEFISAYEKADKKEQAVLMKLFPEVFIKEDPYLKACKILDIIPIPEMADRSNKDLVSADAFYRLTICIRAKNTFNGKVWKRKYDGVEKAWFPRWDKNKDNAGFGLAHAICDGWLALTSVGERLEYRTEALLLEGIKEFDQYYQDLLSV